MRAPTPAAPPRGDGRPPPLTASLASPASPAAPQEHALRRLDAVVDSQWAECSELEALTRIEAMSEDARLPPASRHLAASVASKCYYHLEDYSQALRLALAAGPHFDVNARTQYVETIVG